MKLERIQKRAEKIIGEGVTDLRELSQDKTLKKMKVITEGNHVLSDLVNWLKSGSKLRSIPCRTNRYHNSFLPYAIRLLNDTM